MTVEPAKIIIECSDTIFRYVHAQGVSSFFLGLEGIAPLLSQSPLGLLPSTSPVITFSAKLPVFSITFFLRLSLLPPLHLQLSFVVAFA